MAGSGPARRLNRARAARRASAGKWREREAHGAGHVICLCLAELERALLAG